MAALDQIINQMPVANQRRQQQAQAATDLQLQQAVKAVPTAAATPQVAQQLGAAAQQNVGAQMIETAKQNLATTQQAAGMELQQKQAQLQQGLSDLRRGQDTQQLSDEQALANLSEQAKREMFDSRMQFARDEMGREYMNERQLADYAVTHARDVEQLRNYAQSAEQLHQRKLQMMEAAQQRINQELQFQNSLSNQKQDQNLMRQLAESKRSLEERIAKQKADQANRTGTFSTIGGIGGAVAGGIIGGPAGAAAGYSAVSAVGTMAAQ